ncbi:hypothetical protein [Halorubrum sp. CSM-61]|nr:hypothetical protein [Halorubrum sp. CSM-61]
MTIDDFLEQSDPIDPQIGTTVAGWAGVLRGRGPTGDRRRTGDA